MRRAAKALQRGVKIWMKVGLPVCALESKFNCKMLAAMAALNKGPYITDAIRMQDDILRRMSGQQSKKKSLLRALRSWDSHDLL